MAMIVVGGGGRGAGKTALMCGLMRALPEIPWTAMKITTHEHGKADSDLGGDDCRARRPTRRGTSLRERSARCW